MLTQNVCQEINSLLVAIQNCRKSGNSLWLEKHENTLSAIERMLPSGSGIDTGTKIDRDSSKPGKQIVLSFSYHHMNESGYYDGWTDHRVTIRPSFDRCGFDLLISGRNRNDIKDYLYEVYQHALSEPYKPQVADEVST